MPTTFTKEWGVTFNAAAVAFSKDINGLMKVDPSASKVLKMILEGPQSPMGIIGALTELDKIDLTAGSDKQIAALPGNIKLYKAAMAKLTAEKAKYMKEIDEAMNAKVTLKDIHGYALPTPLKDKFPDSYRQLKVLKTEVEATHARATNALAAAENRGKVVKIDAATAKAEKKVAGFDDAANAQLKAIRDDAAMKKFIVAFAPSFKSSMSKAAVVIQKIKASPTVAVYNKEMNDGGRDISQNLVNIKKIKANPDFAKSSFAKKLPDPGSMATDITPFANGNRRNLAPTATPADVKKALEDFTALYKKIATTYADVLAGKF